MTRIPSAEFSRRALEIEWLLLDVDGVLTDGGIYYDRRGHGILRFNVQDGLGLRLAQKAGLKTGLLSGRGSRALSHRAKELDFDFVVMGSNNKEADFERFLEQHGVIPKQVAYAGDDLSDLRLLGRCGLSFAPANAVSEVRTVAHRVLQKAGGHGAVRELVEALLQARGDWEEQLGPFTFESG